MSGAQLAGGLGGVLEKNDEVTEVVDKIKPVLEEKTGLTFESLEVIHYRPQTVAGRNYFVKAKAKIAGGEEQIVHLRIYQDLKRQLELTAYQLGKTLGDEIACRKIQKKKSYVLVQKWPQIDISGQRDQDQAYRER